MPTYGPSDYLDLGNWNAVCSMCGKKRKASELVKNWQGMYRCPEHNEVRHPQEYVRAVPDIQTPPWVQPDSDVFVEFCTPLGMTGIVDVGVVDCAIVDYRSPLLGPYDLPILAQVFLTSGTQWTVPANWDPNNNWVECVGLGGPGNVGGGGGGAYAKVSNLNISGVVQYSLTSGVWFNGTNFNNASVAAQNGVAGTAVQGGSGGSGASSRGDITYSGGNGGNPGPAGQAGGGGGGAAGPRGLGLPGSAGATLTIGGVGGGGDFGQSPGGSGGNFPTPAGNGVGDAWWNSTNGIGSGGGGGAFNGGVLLQGGTGGSYGGGGGGGNGLGGPGIIVISYVIVEPIMT